MGTPGRLQPPATAARTHDDATVALISNRSSIGSVCGLAVDAPAIRYSDRKRSVCAEVKLSALAGEGEENEAANVNVNFHRMSTAVGLAFMVQNDGASTRRKQLRGRDCQEPPGADPHARRCGGREVNLLGYQIGFSFQSLLQQP